MPLTQLPLQNIQEVDVPLPYQNMDNLKQQQRELEELDVAYPMTSLVFQVESKCFFFYQEKALEDSQR